VIDGIILNLIIKPLITRLNDMDKDLLHMKNTSVYNECRMFCLYVKECHGGIFRSLIFSALIDPQRKLQVEREQDAHNQPAPNKVHELPCPSAHDVCVQLFDIVQGRSIDEHRSTRIRIGRTSSK
jgi:hypothetical protein